MDPMNPTGAQGNVGELPPDAVALLVWREGLGPQPLTVVVSKQSWEMNQKVIREAGMVFNRERVYEFESPTGPQGRKTVFHFQGVTSWAANYDTGIVPVHGELKK